jgi:hypothetical protein
MDLEAHHGLDPSHPEHIWLLHHLFFKSVQMPRSGLMLGIHTSCRSKDSVNIVLVIYSFSECCKKALEG